MGTRKTLDFTHNTSPVAEEGLLAAVASVPKVMGQPCCRRSGDSGYDQFLVCRPTGVNRLGMVSPEFEVGTTPESKEQTCSPGPNHYSGALRSTAVS
jgi:hypothetical protein